MQIFVLQNKVAAISRDGRLLPFGFKFPFQNKSILMKSNLNSNKMTNQLAQQMINNVQVKVQINLVSDINLKCKL